ncbi:MAG TPA: hypothetical protein VFQ61_38380 [Polyangiaceae bacterium]|nr:hypothetical protein [Polyangiaceae bacterium]
MSGHTPSGAALEEHLRQCPACRALCEDGAGLGQLLARAASLDNSGSDALLSRLTSTVDAEVGLRARLRAASTRKRTMIVAGVGLVAVLIPSLSKARPSWPPVGEFVASLFALFALAALCVRFALRPLSEARKSMLSTLLAAISLAVPFLLAIVAPFASRAPEGHAPHAWACFSFGAAFSFPVLLVLRLLERSERPPILALVLSAATTGLVANAVLALHCPSDDSLHLLLGHASIGAGWLLAAACQRVVTSRARRGPPE